MVLYQPPKATWIMRRPPTTPKLTIENARSPRAFSFFVRRFFGDARRSQAILSAQVRYCIRCRGTSAETGASRSITTFASKQPDGSNPSADRHSGRREATIRNPEIILRDSRCTRAPNDGLTMDCFAPLAMTPMTRDATLRSRGADAHARFVLRQVYTQHS